MPLGVKSLIIDVLQRTVGEFIVGLDQDNLKVGVTSGEIVLTDLELNTAALARFHLPVDVRSARVESLLLIAGVQRHVAAGGLAGWHRMRIGSHLLVVDTSPDGLYGVERQRELMLARGCCVQLGVSFIGSGPPQSYLFEANVDGDMLALPAVDAADSDADSDDGIEILVADLNGMTGGRFWQQAARVPSWVDPEVA